jgi:hypothetical protein
MEQAIKKEYTYATPKTDAINNQTRLQLASDGDRLEM